MNRLIPVLAVLALTGCKMEPRLPYSAQVPQQPTAQAVQQQAAEFERVFTPQERALIEATIRARLQYPASAKFTDWAVLNAEKKTGYVSIEATNSYGTRRAFRLYLFQVNKDGTVTAEPYVRGM